MLLLCLFKNIGVKLVSRTDEGDGEGEEERQTEDLSSWLLLLPLQTFYADFVQMFIFSV